jgi:integrase
VTPALIKNGRNRPSDTELRRALYQWRFNVGAQSQDLTPEVARVHSWLAGNSRPLTDLMEADVTRDALETLAMRLDGTQAAQTTIARKRAVFYGALRYAVETDRLVTHPMDKVHWVTPKATDEVDRRVVVNPQQARALLGEVARIDPGMAAFFASIYYAGLRPAEVSIYAPPTAFFRELVGASCC